MIVLQRSYRTLIKKKLGITIHLWSHPSDRDYWSKHISQERKMIQKIWGYTKNKLMSVKVAVKNDKVIAIEYNDQTDEPSTDTAPENTPG